jgi:hypothetical protein
MPLDIGLTETRGAPASITPLGLLLLSLFLLTPRTAEPQGQRAVPWWDYDWQNRVRILLSPADGSAGTVQVRIDLDDQVAPLFSWEAEGRDLRFVYYDPSTETHHTLSHWLNTDRITHGAWFACCSSNYMQYHTPAATYYTCNRPKAVRYEGIHDRTYFVYGDFSRDPVIRYFDHDTKELSPAMLPGQTPLPHDAHGNPSILIDESGYIYVFYGTHGHPIRMRKSLGPESIDEWSGEHVIDAAASYPQPFMLDPSTIVLSYRRDDLLQTRSWSFETSTDGGLTWSGYNHLIYAHEAAIYGISEVGIEDPVRSYHLAFNPFNYQTNHYPNIYYIHSDDGMTTFKTRDGIDLGVPPYTLSEADLVFDSGDLSSHINDLVLDGEGNPYILFNVGPWNAIEVAGPGEWRAARHNGSEWETSHIAPCDHLFDRGCLVRRQGMPLRAYLPVAEDGHDGGEILEYSSHDNGCTWELTGLVTDGSEYSHNYAVSVRNAHPDFETMWSYGNSSPTGAHWRDDASEVMIHGVDGTIGTLEYGRGHAYVLSPALNEPTPIHMYYGNLEAPDVSSFGETMQTSFAHLPSGDLDGNLLLEWLMEQGLGLEIRDYSQYGNNGMSNLGAEAWVGGGSNFERRYDISYDGTVLSFEEGDYVYVPQVNGPDTLSQLTVELWFRPEEETIQPLLALGSPDYGFLVQRYFGNMCFETKTTVLSGGDFETQQIADGKWHHVAAVYDGSDMLLYLDGIKSPTDYPQSGTIQWRGRLLALGRGDAVYYQGQIDETRVYSRALDGDEVRAHYWKVMNADVDVEIGSSPASVAGPAPELVLMGSVLPNPFHRVTQLSYSLQRRQRVDIAVFDVSGRLVRNLVTHRLMEPGYYKVVWDGRNETGSRVASGVYLLKLSAGPTAGVRRLVLIR